MIKVDKWCYKFNHPINEEWLRNNYFYFSSNADGYVHKFIAYKHNNVAVLTGRLIISNEDQLIKLCILASDNTPYGPWYNNNFVQYAPEFIDAIENRIHKELHRLGIVEKVRKNYGRVYSNPVSNRNNI